MAKELYILCESEADGIFYESLAEHVTGMTFSRTDDRFRLRQGANWNTVFASARLMMNQMRNWKEKQDIAVILSVDNDRSPEHPGGVPSSRALPSFDTKKFGRYPALTKIVHEALGSNRAEWPIDVAIAVPVEMIESWVLLLIDPTRGELPIFAEASQPLARKYYGKNPPPQLKELCREEGTKIGLEKELLFFFVASREHGPSHHLAAAEAVSLSLKMFTDELRQWRSN